MRFKKKKKDDPLRQIRLSGMLLDERVSSSSLSVLQQENDAADLVKGKRHRGSGRISGLKSDGSSVRYQLEAKQTEHDRVTVSVAWLEKLSNEAMAVGRVPLLHIRFLNAPIAMIKDWVLVPNKEFEVLFDLARGTDDTLPRWEGVE